MLLAELIGRGLSIYKGNGILTNSPLNKSKNMAETTTNNNSILTDLECKMLEWMNVDIDYAEVTYKDQSEQFDSLFKESEEAFVTLKENKSMDGLTDRQKAIIQEDIQYWGVDTYAEIIELDKEIIQKLCA